MTASEPATPPTRPLPIRPRPAPGDTTLAYIRRLALANYMRPRHLRLCLQEPGHDNRIRLDWLAILSGRTVEALKYALTDQYSADRPQLSASRTPQRTSKVELFASIRRDARERRMSMRELADRHGAGYRTISQALRSGQPAPRKSYPVRPSKLDPFTAIIDDILVSDEHTPIPDRISARAIYDILVTEHAATDISYGMVRNHVGHQRRTTRRELTPAHQAVADYDLPLLRALLDQGHDVESDDGHGRTLLRHAIEVEYTRHDRSGEPLHADISTFLLARGANPHNQDLTGTSCIDHAHQLGHWLVHEILHAWTTRSPKR